MIPFNLTVNFTDIFQHLTPYNIPSFVYLIIFIALILILLKLIFIFLSSISDFLSQYIVPVLIFGIAYFMALLYYNPIYVPNTFVYVSNNTTYVNTTIQNELSHISNIFLIPKYYDTLLYYQVKYNRPIDEILISFMILFIMFIYITFVLWKHIKYYAIFISVPIFFILTLGFKGVISAISIPIIGLIVSGFLAIYFLISILLFTFGDKK